jgi:glycosyltransferase involved in cell wall biosynthesis
VVERRDSAAMAARILDLLRDQELRGRMGEAGRAAVREKFNLRLNVAQLIGLYGI